MKIAIPLAGGKLTAHFGHCQDFAIIDVDENNQITKNESLVPPAHEPGVLPRWLGELGVNIIIAGGMGQMAINLFEQNNITVVTGASPMEPEALVKSYLEQTLTTGGNACNH